MRGGYALSDKLEIGNAVALMSFAAVVDSGSFSAAAEALGYSKAAVSRQISQLESRIGLKLLDRTTRSIALTPAGREIYNRSVRIIDEVKETNDLLAGIQSTPSGNLRINAPVVASIFRITEVIPEFLGKYPDIKLFINLSDSQVDLLKDEFDIAFWVGDTYDSSLDAVKLCDYEMVLAGSRKYLLRHGRPRTPSELKEHDCIVETHLSRPGEWRLSSDQTISINRVRLTSNSVRVT
ncbi:MAG: LysR family transcriptional regulator, partial [Alphaproteobacteria bacterium]|nr:LysR family transcriptional regulator [Alphaproteobacteria bacterium]